jgi:hypothetical protein
LSIPAPPIRLMQHPLINDPWRPERLHADISHRV